MVITFQFDGCPFDVVMPAQPLSFVATSRIVKSGEGSFNISNMSSEEFDGYYTLDVDLRYSADKSCPYPWCDDFTGRYLTYISDTSGISWPASSRTTYTQDGVTHIRSIFSSIPMLPTQHYKIVVKDDISYSVGCVGITMKVLKNG